MTARIVAWGAVFALLPACWEGTEPKGRPDLGTADGGGPGDAAAPACAPAARGCDPLGRPQVCTADAVWAVLAACGDGQRCDAGDCVDHLACEMGQSRCGDESTLQICNDARSGWDDVPCEGTCRMTGDAATCDDVSCLPGERVCNGDQVVLVCNEAGTQFDFSQRCDGGRTGKQCDGGECVPLCILSEKVKTNVGCDYWAADLDNAFVPGGSGFLDAAAAPYAVVVSNPHPDFTAEVSIYEKDGADADLVTVQSALVPPLGLQVFLLPRRDADGTVQAYRAYRVRSSIPIVAYQFNPLDNEDVFSNDASLLLPSHVLGDRYLIMTREQTFDRLRGYLTVIGIDEEPTTVRVTVTAPTQPGVGGIPALMPGDTFETTLHAFEVLNIETHAPGADLTGSLVEADAHVVVFGGSEAANVPNTNHCIGRDANHCVEVDEVTGEGVCEYDRTAPCRGDDECGGVCEYDPTVPCEDNYDCNDANLNTCCADHLEQQLFPIATWGRHYIGTKSYDRGLENDYWRILAAEDDTKVETVPPQAIIPTLDAGKWFEFGSREHFEIISDKPIMVGQFLASEQAPNPNLRDIIEEGDAGIGDPAFILAVPVEQFRGDFVFLAPDKYALDYVSVIAPVGAQVFFDEVPIPVSWEPVGEGDTWHIARFPIGDGVHFIQSDLPLSVIVYGYDQYVSYGYPGGLNLDVVDPETGEAEP